MEHDDVQEPSRRVLIVDDEPTIRAALRRFFQKRGWVVEEAEDGEQALAQLAAADPGYRLVVTDVRMPKMSGMELYQHATAAHPWLRDRFVFSSGDAEAPGITEFCAASGCTVLGKPFTLDALERAVERGGG